MSLESSAKANDCGRADVSTLPGESMGPVGLVKIVVVTAWLVGVFLTLPLWTQERAYPLAPVSPYADVGPWLTRALLIGLIVLLAATLFVPRPRILLLGAVLLATGLAVLDQTRWQPWFYQYVVMSGVLGCYAWSPRPERRLLGQDACRVILAGTYFWSGAQKLNVTFVNEGFPWLLKPFWGELEPPGWLLLLAWTVPFVESGFALTLLTSWRRGAVIAALAMHAFILLAIGPFGQNWNSVVWPWNAAMMLLVPALFWNAPPGSIGRIMGSRRAWAARVAVLLFGILPGLNFVGLWDAYLSAALYSGSIPRARVWITPQLEARLPPEIRRHVASDQGRLHIDLFGWALAELGVPPYPAERVYRGIARRLCVYAQAPRDLVLVVGGRPNWLTGRRRVREWNCAELATSAGRPAHPLALVDPAN